MIRLLILMTATVAVFASTSCSKNKEADDLAKAQKCLDEVPTGGYTQAYSCLEYVKEYDSQQANILKCAIVHTSGGLMEDKVIKAYNALKGAAQNSTTAFMAVMSLDQPDIAGGYAKAKEGDVYCQASGVSGLKYISGIIVAGSFMNVSIAALNGGAGIDITDPVAIDTVVSDLLVKCGVQTPDPSCNTDLATLGSTVVTLHASYCSTPDANQDICGQIQSAVDAAGGNTTDVGQALLCYLNNKTFDSTTHQCNP